MADPIRLAHNAIRHANVVVAQGKTEQANDVAALIMREIRNGQQIPEEWLQRNPDMEYRKPGEIPTDLQTFVEDQMGEFRAKGAGWINEVNSGTVTRLLKKRLNEQQQLDQDLEEFDG